MQQLLDIIEALSVSVKYDRGNFKGGLIRYHEDNIYYINRKADIDTKLQTIVNELKQMRIPEKLISPELRLAFPELLEPQPENIENQAETEQ